MNLKFKLQKKQNLILWIEYKFQFKILQTMDNYTTHKYIMKNY